MRRPSLPTNSPATPTKGCWAALALASGLALTGCASLVPPVTPPAASATQSVLTPPAALLLQGVPPVPAAMADAVVRFSDFAGHVLQDWHPSRRELLATHRPAGGNIAQLYRVTAPDAPGSPSTPSTLPEALTEGPEPIAAAWYVPQGDGQNIVLARGTGGNEVYQLYRLTPPSRSQTLLTDPDQRHNLDVWLNRSALALVSSVPLDRTASGGKRAEVSTRLWLMDPARPGERRDLATLPGGGWSAAAVSPDDRQAALLRYVSATEAEVWLLDLASGVTRRVLPASGAPTGTHPSAYFPQAFSADGQTLFLISDQASEFRELMALSLASGALQRLSAHLPWDVESAQLAPNGQLLALQLNVAGREELRVIDARTGQDLTLPGMANLPAGSVQRLLFHRQTGELAFSLGGARGPGQIHSLNLASASPEAWTRARLHPALDVSGLTEQQIVRWTSFDGRSISGLLNRPPARFTGRRPVLINIHGGPESQAKIGFAGRNNYLLQELGITIIQPNVRGSSGYGKTFVGLDNGRLREDSVKDIGALLDWIATQPDLDAQRVVVAGGSYGGYMSLAVATTYPQRIAGSIDVVGISNFVSFLENTESYRRDLRRVEYGDERDPLMRAFLQRISPLTHAARITRPLLVVQGKNDPRVPYTEAEQIVAQVRGNGTPVWYVRAENEGHGFARKENADYQFYLTVMFLRRVLDLGD